MTGRLMGKGPPPSSRTSRFHNQQLSWAHCSSSFALLQVREALAQKISRERVGTELDGMFNGECDPSF